MNAGGERNAPPTVYRALDFLLKHGLIHRIESMNAFVGCATPADTHKGQFFICRACGNVAETHSEDISEAIEESATQAGFWWRRQSWKSVAGAWSVMTMNDARLPSSP